MPVSPQDYALWSDLTGNPYPQTPAERMAFAPEVYSFTRDVNQGRRPPGAIRRAVDVIGKTALAAGAIAGGVYLAKNFGTLELDDEPHIGTPPQPQGFVPTAVTDVTPPTTSDRYGQDVVPHQTAVMGLLRGTSPGKPTVVDSEEKPATQSHVISTSQSFGPGSEIEQLATSAVPHSPVRDRADDLIAEYLGGVAAEQRAQKRIDQSVAEYGAMVADKATPVLKAVLKEGRQEGISPVGRSSVAAAERFRGTPAYTAMMQAAGASMEPEELVGAPGATPVFTEVRATPQTRIAAPAPTPTPAPAPARGVVTAAVPAAFSTPPSRSAESAELEKLSRLSGVPVEVLRQAAFKTRAPEEIVTRQPKSVRVSEDIGDTTAKLLRQAKAMRTSREEAGGMISQDIPTGPIHNISVSPANEVAVTYRTKAGSQTYNFDADPKYVNELVDRIQRGSFVKGQDSAGGFINAGRSMGLLQ